MSLLSRVANVFRGERLNRDIEEEYASHLEEAILAGRDPAEARKALGDTLRRRDESHDIRVVAWADAVRADFLFGWRQVKRNRVTSAAAIVSLALAIGACTSAFRLIDALLWRPLPVAHPERLYVLSRRGMGFDNKPGEWDSWAYPDFQLMRAAAKGEAELIAVSYADRSDITYRTDQEMEKAVVQYVSGWMFPTFGIKPAAGRLFTEKDDRTPGAAPYAVLSYDYWTRRFGRDPGVVGRTFQYGDGVYEIVGVSGKEFTGTEPGIVVDIFVPTMMHRGVARRDSTWMRTLAVVAPGVAIEPLRAKLAAINYAFERNRLSGETGLSQETLRNVLANQVRLEPAPTGASGMQKEYSRALAAIGLLVVMVLLIACVNVANLMTAQAATRAREMALRVSIGAGRMRLVRLVLAESALLAFFAALGGALFSWWSAPFVVNMINPPDNPARLILPADWRVLGFGMLLIACVVLLFGLVPALRASSVKPVSALRGDDSHARPGLMHGMIAAQVAFCFLVVFVAGLFVTTFERLSTKPTGFSAEGLLLLDTVAHRPQPAAYWDQVEDHLRAMPGVDRVSQAAWPLLGGDSWNDSISFNGGPPSVDLGYFLNVSPGFFETMRIPLLAGRDFRQSDGYPPAAIVNQTFAREFLKDNNPVGRSFDKASDDGSRERMQVVGVVADAYYSNIRTMLPVVFVPIHRPLSQTALRPMSEVTYIVRISSANPLSLASQLRQEVGRVRPELRVSNVQTQKELLDAQTIRERMLATLAMFFAVVAILLAGVGLYGVLFYSVVQRHREIGIRIALGARSGNVVRPIVSGISIALAFGTVTGLAFGVLSTRYIESLLYQVKASDPIQLAGPCLIIFLAAIFAAAPAVVRALYINPADLLRSE
ncbi:MAG TPA: ABC transporter permease [Acidobacteriaceae bacterium]|nr:ABC transporter permease [Acidobacteriaceae bacterium]